MRIVFGQAGYCTAGEVITLKKIELSVHERSRQLPGPITPEIKENNKDWAPYWQDEDTAILHFIGKDNIVFHAIIFPTILKAHGDYQLPSNL